MGSHRRERALAVAALLHGVVACAWFVLGIFLPGAPVLRDGLLLVPTFVASGILVMNSRLVVAQPYMAWAVALVDVLGLAPIGLYMARLLLARDTPAGAVLWLMNQDLTLFVLVTLGATAAVHIITIGIALHFVFAT